MHRSLAIAVTDPWSDLTQLLLIFPICADNMLGIKDIEVHFQDDIRFFLKSKMIDHNLSQLSTFNMVKRLYLVGAELSADHVGDLH